MTYEMDPEQAFLNAMKMDAYNPEHNFMNTEEHPTEDSGDKNEERKEEIQEDFQTGAPLDTHNVENQEESTPSNVPAEDNADANTAAPGAVTSSDSPFTLFSSAIVQDESASDPQPAEPSELDTAGTGENDDAQKSTVNFPSAVEVQLRESESVPPQASTPTPQPGVSFPTPTPEPPRTSSAPPSADSDGVNVGTTTSSNKRKRLPQDKIGQLEDRIAEDPRGDIDAWLRLIDEHQKKGKLDEARAAYERFLEIWPHSVCILQCDLLTFV
jgi:cleavage stimulation factor subunit 3